VKHGFDLNLWTLIGFVGQGFFFSRFLVQWIASERRRQSVIPLSFWFFSLAGSIVLLAYGLHRKDLVIILGQIPGAFIYSRNLWLLRKNAPEAQPPVIG
jgi:lipid-A-disaccharide synthase-like uncharacterized protein